jgi:hypothetical protein
MTMLGICPVEDVAACLVKMAYGISKLSCPNFPRLILLCKTHKIRTKMTRVHVLESIVSTISSHIDQGAHSMTADSAKIVDLPIRLPS